MPTRYRRSAGPIGETAQDNLANNCTWQHWDYPPWDLRHWALPDHGPRRGAPAELPFVNWDAAHGWHRPSPQGPVKLAGFRARKFWARPSDGKRGGALGRLKDALTGEGPDVFVVLNGDRRTLARDLPHRAQWSRWGGPLWEERCWGGRDRDRTAGEAVHWNPGWVRRSARGERYNFASRRYEAPEERARSHQSGRLWTDARWGPGVRRGDREPESLRRGPGEYETKVPVWAGRFPGGRPWGW